MENHRYSEIVFILDRSGSMESLRSGTIDSFNLFLKSQRELPDTARLTLVLFDDAVEFVCSGVPLSEVLPLDYSTYVPQGRTALLDAVGVTIDRTEERLSALPEAERPEVVIVVILTDGQENASREYLMHEVTDQIRALREKAGWKFIFLGANQDAWAEAGKLGMDRARGFAADNEGVAEVLYQVDLMVREAREGGEDK